MRSSASACTCAICASSVSARILDFCSCASRMSFCSSGDWPMSSCSVSCRWRSRCASASSCRPFSSAAATEAVSACCLCSSSPTSPSCCSMVLRSSSTCCWSILSTSSSGRSSGEAALRCSSWTCRSSSTCSGLACASAWVSSASLETFFTSARDSCSCRSASASISSCRSRLRDSSCSCRWSASIFASRLSSPWAAAAVASRLAWTCAPAACMHLPTASSSAPSCRARATPGLLPAAWLASEGCCLAAATASNCMRRRVFGTSLPRSTSVGSKSGARPRQPPTASAM
mmetsp:Transcript_63676/g.205156  ORF Transcript_63676/g.205156 Transcript_63676/m.205156 type:complete len:288 (-) Transcript_63676:1608-2471(-)